MTELRGPVRRVTIENVRPEVNGGQFPIKRTAGDTVEVTADIFADGHDLLSAEILYRPLGQSQWQSAPMRPLVNDRWTGSFVISVTQDYVYTVRAWPDPFQTWAHDLEKRRAADQDLSLEFLIGADLVAKAADRATGDDGVGLRREAETLTQLHQSDPERAYEAAQSEELLAAVRRNPDLRISTTYTKELRVWVDRELARFGAWYEMFPRSCTEDPAGHGTFQNCIARLDYVAGMGFDILYLPPIHPI